MHSGREFLCGFIAIGGCRCTPFFIEEKLAVFHTKIRVFDVGEGRRISRRTAVGCSWNMAWFACPAVISMPFSFSVLHGYRGEKS